MTTTTLARSARSAFTLLELVITLTILVVAGSMLVRTVIGVGKVEQTNSDTSRAMRACRNVCESLNSGQFGQIFARYNADGQDDPGGVDSAPGATFQVPGLTVRPDDADGFVGSIAFPTNGDELREDFVDPRMGMPRDLNGDGAIDAANHAGDYIILPFRVRLEWRGSGGDRVFELYSAAAEHRWAP